MNQVIEFQLNGKPAQLETDLTRPLIAVLRADLGLTGAKLACGIGICGACTVLIDQRAYRACQMMLMDVEGKEVLTIEGLAQGQQLHPLQQAFVEHGALQCGYCTPGMILQAYSLLRQKPTPTEEEIISGMNGNLCRCGAHPRIVQAIRSAAPLMNGGLP